MNLSAGNEYLIRIAIGFLVSMGFGFAFLKSYDEFRKAIKTNSRLRLWIAFSSAVFLLILILLLFSR